MIDTNKIFYILLSIVLVIVICIGLNVYINWRNSECEYNNQKIVDFTVELVKGNKSISEINELEVEESIKESFINYYNETFLEDNSEELYKLFDDVSYFNSVVDDIKNIQINYGDSLLRDNEGYAYSIAVNESGEESSIDKRYEFIYLNYLYMNENKKSSGIFEKDNCLYIRLSDIHFDELGKCNLFYNGLSFNLDITSFNKYNRKERQKDLRFKDIEYFNVFEDNKNEYRYVYKSTNNLYNGSIIIYTTIKFNRIVDVRIEEKV